MYNVRMDIPEFKNHDLSLLKTALKFSYKIINETSLSQVHTDIIFKTINILLFIIK